MNTPSESDVTGEAGGAAGPRLALQKSGKDSKSPRIAHLPDWWILLTALIVSTAAAFGVATLSERATKRLEVSQQLDRLQASVNRESALESQSIAIKSVNQRFREEFRAARQASTAALRRVRELGPRSQASGQLIDAYGDYRTAVDLEQAFLGRGDVRGAKQLDRQRVRPAFRKLHALSSKIGAQYTHDAEDAIQLIVWGTSGLVTVAALTVGILFLLYSHREQRVLRQSERRFRSLVQNSSDVIALVDADARVSFITPAVKGVLGYEQADLLGTHAFDLVHPSDLTPSQESYSQLVAHDGAVATAELRVRHKDGSWRWIEATATNLLHEPGIDSIVTNYHDVTGRKELEAKLTHQALHDSLTLLANRVLLKERIGHALLRRTETKRSLAVLFVDLNDFKTVNDTLGHEVGDQLLIAVARRLETSLRPADTLARLGGDEFAILLEDMQHPADAVMVAERIVEALKEPFDLETKQLFVQASIGIVTDISPDADTDQLLHNADTAMYVAKSRGKGGYEIFEPRMQEALMRRLELKTDLSRAVDKGEFSLSYQPVFELATRTVHGVEALLRWQHPTRGLIPPLEFISLAEDTSLILPLGRWVLREACQQAKRWQNQCGVASLSINVNVSVTQLGDAGLADDLAQILKDSQLPPESLILEVTESVLMRETDAISRNLERFKEIGARVAIDDFGTGYSSLGYLRRFPVDLIKIDKSFIDGVGQGAEASAIVRAIVRLSHSLDLLTCAEGIESEVQIAELDALGCALGQGFYYAKPLEADAIALFLVEHHVPPEPDRHRARKPSAGSSPSSR